MEKFEPETKNTVPRLGPAPERIGVMPKAPAQVDAAPSMRPVPAHPLRWIGKRLAIWSFGSIFFGTVFHFTGIVLVGVVALLFPIVYWVAFIFEGQMTWGIAAPEKDPFADMRMRMAEDFDRDARRRMYGF